MTGFLPANQTLVRYISPDGVALNLSGRPEAGREGVWIGQGPDGLGHVDVKPVFEAASRQIGERYVGETVDHLEIDLPIHILADTPEAFRSKRRWVEDTIQRKRPGWLCAYTPSTGWLWLAVRKISMVPAYAQDPGPRAGATFDLLLAAEQPFAREPDDTDEWVNRSMTGRGELHLYPGPSEWVSWPQFILRGPGRFRMRWGGNDVTFPQIQADEWILVNTDESRTLIRSRDSRGIDRNLWPQMPPGTRIPNPLPPAQVSRVDVEVSGGNRDTSAWGTVAVRREGLV